MSKKLEDYVKGQRREFDLDSPSEELWGRIANQLDEQKIKKPLRLQVWIGIAASLIAIMSISFFYTYHNRPQEVSIADVNPLYARKEMRFASLIEEKKDSLEVFGKENPALYKQFSADLEKLDADYERLKQELQNSPNRRLIVKAMVKNLELQLEVINQQLTIIYQVEEIKKENRI
ncbi:MAG: hypothetical protein WKF66_01375 [Pedobacter sp.]